MSETINVTTQGISDDLATGNGDYDSTEWGDMAEARLAEFLTRVQDVSSPPPDMADDCPPHVLTNGPGGRWSYEVGGGTITGHLLGSEGIGVMALERLTPEEAAGLASGNMEAEALFQTKGRQDQPEPEPKKKSRRFWPFGRK